ncbi:hypothetical protein A3709_13595 [Halioglobus sp. HI00S01]|uniref:hypothetical protein n=1 Tax=Halioglobus sp. HI00S01 TaxID=1822214 RepID=UPI0007C20062|nr:hypothetical protein [Halioglobus sp. HI00S01]KZX59329.1 hypothetical protein A3709_13595 [Halioglobus sp. HI00S01]
MTNEFYNLTANWTIGDWILTSITGYIERPEDFRVEYDAAQVKFLTVLAEQKYEQFSQELRINSDLTENISLIAGLYYWNS